MHCELQPWALRNPCYSKKVKYIPKFIITKMYNIVQIRINLYVSDTKLTLMESVRKEVGVN